jgi:hypothetical protein
VLKNGGYIPPAPLFQGLLKLGFPLEQAGEGTDARGGKPIFNSLFDVFEDRARRRKNGLAAAMAANRGPAHAVSRANRRDAAPYLMPACMNDWMNCR